MRLVLKSKREIGVKKFMGSIKRLCTETGQSIVELALITPLLLVALYVPIDFAISLFMAQSAQDAAREGDRIAAILPDCSTGPSGDCITAGTTGPENCPGTTKVVQEVCDRLPTLLVSNGAEVTVNLTGNVGDACRRMVTVDVVSTYDFGFYRLMALIGFPLSTTTLPINRSAEARYELQQVSNTDTSCT